MPRWLWLTVAALLVGLTLVGRGTRTAQLPAAAANATACAMPAQFTDAANPLQSQVNGRMLPFNIQGVRFSPQAGFSLQARVLSREDYSMGREARFSPTDLALGWGPMSEPGMADRLQVSQGGRWYRYRWGNDGPPLPVATIARNSANMHMVPFDANVAKQLERIKDGDLVRIHGWLLHIDDPSGWRWHSSMSREDVGAGACELVLVCSIGN